MKKNVILFTFLFTVQAAYAGQDGIGLGVILGEPTGVSFKTWTGARTAIDAAAAWSFSENDSFQFHADYLIHPLLAPKPREIKGSIFFHYGIGGRLKLKGSDEGKSRNAIDNLFGLRFPLGFSHILTDAPVEFFAEFVPILYIAPDTGTDLNAAAGARYYFK